MSNRYHIGAIVHVRYEVSGIDVGPNQPALPCRAAIVTGPERDGKVPVTILAAFTNPSHGTVIAPHWPGACSYGFGPDAHVVPDSATTG